MVKFMKQLFGQSAIPWVQATAVGLCGVFIPVSLALAQSPQPVQESPASPRLDTTKKYPPVQVVDGPLEYRQFEKVEITGSAILAKEAKQALPLQVIDRREIERSGATNLPELIQRLPVMSNFSELGMMTGTVAGGPETAAIHGNQSGTLVLLNGRRLPYYGSQTIMGERAVVDLNFLPLAAVERIEILTDGASSRYGSDAVAGVINVITNAEVRGLGIATEVSLPQGGHGQGQGMNLSWGKGRLQRDGYSLRAYFTAQKTQALLAKDREVSSQGARAVNINGVDWWQRYNHSLPSAPAQNYLDADGYLRNDYFDQNLQCETGWYELYRGACDKNAQGAMTLYPETSKQLLYTQGDWHLNNNWVLFAEGLLSRQTQDSVASGDNWWLNVPNADQTRSYFLQFLPLGLPRQRYQTQMHNEVVGVRGEQSGWAVVASLSNGLHKVDRYRTDGLAKPGLESIQLTPELIKQDPAEYSASNLAAFEEFRDPAYRMDTGWAQLTSLSVLASREWMETEHGPVQVGVGFDWRKEHVSYEAADNEVRPAFDARRSNWATHVEVQSPLGSNSEVTAAVRHDQYSDFGAVQTGKLGWKWKPTAHWMLRGSVGTGFRAPSMGQMVPVKTTIDSTYDAATDAYVQAVNMGSPLLKPEKSVQMTWGLRFEPSPRLTIGADLWQLNIRDTFGLLTSEQILGNEQLMATYFVDNEIVQSNQNLGRSIRRGLDYDLQWRDPTDIGRVRVSLRGTHMFKSVTQEAETGAFTSNVGLSSNYAPLITLRNQWTLSAFLERSEWTGGVSIHYRSGVHEKTTLTDRDGNLLDYSAKVPGHWTMDLQSRWQLQPKTTLSAGVVNLFNRTPPLRMALSNNALLGVDTGYANYWGRMLHIKLEHKF